MLIRSFIIILLSNVVFSQNILSGYGYGSSKLQSSPSSLALSNSLLPSFKNDVALSNPSSWHNLAFVHLNTAADLQQSIYEDFSSTNFSLSSVKLIVPWKNEISFGISFEPFLEREIVTDDSTSTKISLSDQEINYKRTNTSSGGPSIAKFSFGNKLNDFESIGLSFGYIFGSSRLTKKLNVDSENYLVQSRDFFSGSLLELYFSTSRLNKSGKIDLFLGYGMSLNDLDIENNSYQVFLDLNNNNSHDNNDYPSVSQSLPPEITFYDNEIKISDIRIGLDYEFSLRKHLQFEYANFRDSGNHSSNSSLFSSFVSGKEKFSLSYAKFAKPLSRDRINFRSSINYQDFDVENFQKVSEIGLGIGLGINFGITGNQIDFGYNVSKRKNVLNKNDELLQIFSIGVSIADLWFVKRREI
tara:strand:+ start:1624 stop:2865 length:1242 start_codon:yes stop_codon:yes gene_type:complete